MGKKIFYTERDIEHLIEQGAKNLIIHDDLVLTDLAREKAVKLGLSLIERLEGPSLFAPIQMDIQTPPAITLNDLSAKIKATVITRIENKVSEELLDAVIPKVLAQLKIGE